ncbi:MAG: hypothetical protein ABIF71_09385 [Planctomycetota bacterium]
MELKSVEVDLDDGEKVELLKRTVNDRTKELLEVERRIRELKREDAERDYLAAFIGVEYINPEGQNHAAEIEPLMQKRELLAYIVTMSEKKLNEVLHGMPAGAAAAAAAAPLRNRSLPGSSPKGGAGRAQWGNPSA